MWDAQLTLAASGWRVIAPHLRGMDGGEWDPETTSMDDYAGDVIDLLDGLHVHEAVIAGLSLGGYVAFAIFRHAHRYFRGLVLADTRAEADTPEGVEGRRTALALLHERGPRAIADDVIPKLLGATTRAGNPDVVERVRDLILSNSERAIAGAIQALMTRPDSTPILSSIHCPTLVIVGAEDTLTPLALSETLHARIAGSELVVVPGAGHLSNLENPAAFNAALGNFLEHRV
jgi:pimeloyl-ACP methyl ester carboxylesterase